MRCLIGLEIEWYLLRIAEDHLSEEHIGSPGIKGRADQDVPSGGGLCTPLRK